MSAKIKVNSEVIQDAANIANGVYFPLKGFLKQKDYLSVLDEMRLADGRVWSLPIVIDIDAGEKEKLAGQDTVELIGPTDESVILKNIEVYSYDKNDWAQKVYGTLDLEHPGVARLMSRREFLLGGEVVAVKNFEKIFPEYNFNSEAAKKIFRQKDWKTIVAFQTRNIPHLGHEFLQNKALENVDGIFIQPVIGEKKAEDFKDEYIILAYNLLIQEYLPAGRALLGILPLRMRYAGPREAVMHALVRRNFGCTHFIVGRDHAGVNGYYGPEDAKKIFDQFSLEELGIEIFKYNEVVYDQKNGRHCFVDECGEDDKIEFSGTKLRQYIQEKKEPPPYLLRPEIYELLISNPNLLVDKMYQARKNKNNFTCPGFVLWFTGLSAAGKTTIADKVCEILSERSIGVERLDGDLVRENLTKDLGFSRQDRDENIRRIGFVANLLSRNNVAVIASFISPYEAQRQELRDKINNFIEVFVDTPLEVCEARDPKGLYKKARSGEIKNFTGISDPYERPESPEICLDTSSLSVDDCVAQIISYLEEGNYI